ncbi:MAG: hypothetical protein U1A27_06475 [Phycisphaerae bacterium]
MARSGEPAQIIHPSVPRAAAAPHGPIPRAARRPAAPMAAALGAACFFVYAAVGTHGTFQFEQSTYPHPVLTAHAGLSGRFHATAAELERRYIENRLARVGRILPVNATDEAVRAAYRDAKAGDLRRRGLSEPQIDARIAHYVRGAYHDWVPVNGGYVAYWPPVPALLMVPLVLWRGSGASDILLANLVGAATVAAVYLMLRALRRHWPDLGEPATIGLTVLYGLGTVHLYQACTGQVWFLTQLCATFFLVLAIVAALRIVNHPAWVVVSGVALGLGFLSRNTIILAAPFCAWMLWTGLRGAPRRGRRFVGWGAALGGVLMVAIGVQLWLNQARFGDWRDFGQGRLADAGGNPKFAADFKKYGRFSSHYLPTNLYYYFANFSLRYDHPHYPGQATFDPMGNSLFMVSPAMVFALLAWRARRRDLLWGSLIGMGPGLAALMLFHGTGWYQFGHRYLLDVLPFILLLAALGMRGRLTAIGAPLIALSLAVNAWGTYHFCIEQS